VNGTVAILMLIPALGFCCISGYLYDTFEPSKKVWARVMLALGAIHTLPVLAVAWLSLFETTARMVE